MTLSPNLIQPYLYESPIERDFVGREIKDKEFASSLGSSQRQGVGG